MILGHERIIEDLKNLAQKRNLAHGYVFFGPERVGKRLVALSLANYLETELFTPPGESKVLSDAILIQPDNQGTISVDVIREIKYFLWQKPNRSPYRTVIIDKSDLLTPEAQNALLKITEEPPSSGLLILIIKEPEMLQSTLLSRLQKLFFSIMREEFIAQWLIEEGFAKPEEAATLAAKSFGQPGRTLELLRGGKFQELLVSARTALRVPATQRKDFIKKLIDPDDFSLKEFLDAMIECVAEGEVKTKEKIALWHKLLDLRREVQYFNLNPRLQLENLL